MIRSKLCNIIKSYNKNFRESKSSVKEIERLRHDIDVKDVAIEELNSKLIGIEREKIKLKRDLEQWNGEQTKVNSFLTIWLHREYVISFGTNKYFT